MPLYVLMEEQAAFLKFESFSLKAPAKMCYYFLPVVWKYSYFGKKVIKKRVIDF